MAYYLDRDSGYIGETIEITGEGLDYDFDVRTRIYFHDNIQATVELISTTVIRAIIPEGATSGTIVISPYKNVLIRTVSSVMPETSADTSMNIVSPITTTLPLSAGSVMPEIHIDTLVES